VPSAAVLLVPFAAVVRRSQESLKAKHHAATGNAYQMMKRTPTQLAKPLSRSNAECLEKTLGRLYPVLVEGIGGAQSVPTHAYARGACSHALFRSRLNPLLAIAGCIGVMGESGDARWPNGPGSVVKISDKEHQDDSGAAAKDHDPAKWWKSGP
jgi:hypothetical protein